MEALAITPDGERFAMGGRLRGGDWNVALFETKTGNRLKTWKTGFRVTDMQFNSGGNRLVIVGTQGQPKDRKDGVYPDFGRVEEHEIS